MSIYSLADGMRDISVPENHQKNHLPIGTILVLNGYDDPRYAIIKNLGIHSRFASHGAQYQCVELESFNLCIKNAFELTPINEKKDNRIQTYITDEKISEAECLELWEKSEAKKTSDGAMREAKAKARLNEIERLKRDHPHLIQVGSGEKSRIIATKNIRIELKRAFPNITFSIKSKSFSMGNDINVRWTDGPTTKEVDKIIQKYQEGSFDGMQDLYEYAHEPWTEIFGGVKYVMASRSYSAGASEKAARDYLDKTGQAYQGLEYQGYEHKGEKIVSGHTIVWREMQSVNLP